MVYTGNLFRYQFVTQPLKSWNLGIKGKHGRTNRQSWQNEIARRGTADERIPYAESCRCYA